MSHSSSYPKPSPIHWWGPRWTGGDQDLSLVSGWDVMGVGQFWIYLIPSWCYSLVTWDCSIECEDCECIPEPVQNQSMIPSYSTVTH